MSTLDNINGINGINDIDSKTQLVIGGLKNLKTGLKKMQSSNVFKRLVAEGQNLQPPSAITQEPPKINISFSTTDMSPIFDLYVKTCEKCGKKSSDVHIIGDQWLCDECAKGVQNV